MTFNLDDYRLPPAFTLPADLDPETRAAAEDAERRAKAVAGLRNLAQMLIDHPELPVPYSIAIQAGPRSDADWDAKRRFVLDAAEVLGLPLTNDTETTVDVDVTLHGHNPWVRYSVFTHRLKPADVAKLVDAARVSPTGGAS